MTRIREFLGTLVGIVVVLGLAFLLISTLEIGTYLRSEDQQVRAIVSTSEPALRDEDLEIHISSTSEPGLQDEIQQLQGTPMAEPTSTTTFLSPLPEPELGEIWFGDREGLCRQPLDSEGRASVPMSCMSLELPSNGAFSSVLRPSPDGSQVLYAIRIVPEECGEGCGGYSTFHVFDVSTGESRRIDTWIVSISSLRPRKEG